MRRVVEDGLDRDPAIAQPLRPDRVAGVQVAVPVREVAGGNLDPDPVPGLEQVSARPELHDELGRLTGRDRPGTIRAAGESRSLERLLDVDRAAGLIDIAELH